MVKRLAAGVYFFIGGNATTCLAWMALRGFDSLIRALSYPTWDRLLFFVLPGVAAVVAAFLARGPFMRAARTRRRADVYNWTFFGVFVAHVAYAVLLFAVLAFFGQAGEEAFAAAGFFGVISFLLGFFPNALFGLCFAEIVLWLERKRLAAPAGA